MSTVCLEYCNFILKLDYSGIYVEILKEIYARILNCGGIIWGKGIFCATEPGLTRNIGAIEIWVIHSFIIRTHQL